MRAACPVATFARQGLHCSGANPAAWRSWLIKPHWPVPPATRGAPAVAGFGRASARTTAAAIAAGRTEAGASKRASRRGWAPDRSCCQEPKSASGTLTAPAPLVEMAPGARAPSPRAASRQPGRSVTAVASQMLKVVLTPNSYGSDWCLSGETIHTPDPGQQASGRGCELGARRARHQVGRRRSRLRGQHAVEDASGVAPVLGPVGSVDLIVDGVVGIHERHVLLDATVPDPTFVPLLRAAQPCDRRALHVS